MTQNPITIIIDGRKAEGTSQEDNEASGDYAA